MGPSFMPQKFAHGFSFYSSNTKILKNAASLHTHPAYKMWDLFCSEKSLNMYLIAVLTASFLYWWHPYSTT